MSENLAPAAARVDQDINSVLRSMHTIAVVGLSSNPDRPSFGVARYLQEHGYRIIPINPEVTGVLGERAYPDLASVPAEVAIDVADVFRRPEHVPAVVEQALARGIRAIWLQMGADHPLSAEQARARGAVVVEDRCLKVEHSLRRP